MDRQPLVADAGVASYPQPVPVAVAQPVQPVQPAYAQPAYGAATGYAPQPVVVQQQQPVVVQQTPVVVMQQPAVVVQKPATTTTVSTTVTRSTVQAPARFGEPSVYMTCPHCQQNVNTVTTYKMGGLGWIIVLVMFFFGFWLCMCIPCCVPSLQDVDHTCPNCNARVR